jgi:hypothetical protein
LAKVAASAQDLSYQRSIPAHGGRQMELTASFMALLDCFRPAFTAPSFVTFRLLMSGWILSVRHRYVTDLIISSDSVGNGHFSDYHRFFSHAAWAIDAVWRALAKLIVKTCIGPNAVIRLAADDTLCHKRGLSLFGAGMHHDPLISSRAMKLVSWGHDWVIVSIIVGNCRWAPGKVFALPICARLYRNRQGLTKGQKQSPRSSRSSKQQASSGRSATRGRTGKAPSTSANAGHRTRPDLLSEMLTMIAGWFPERRFHVVVDSLYSGRSVLSRLPQNVDLTGPVHPQATLYAPATEEPGKRRGPRRKKGERLSSRDDWAADGTRWQRLHFDQYGLHGTFEVKTRRGLYYKAGKDRLLNFLLSQDVYGKRPTQIFYTTDLQQSARETLSKFSCRWATEVMHCDTKQYLGLEDPANRVPLAVQRTAPMALILYSLTLVWYARVGYDHVRFPERPWYRHKRQPSFRDMLSTLRRLTWEQKLSEVPIHPTPDKNPLDLLIYLGTLAG